jgi:hypothetical protein
MTMLVVARSSTERWASSWRPRLWIPIVALVTYSVACEETAFRRQITPIGELEVSRDGTEGRVRLSKETSATALVNLEIFGSFDPGQRPSADCPFGAPAEMVRHDEDQFCIYDRDHHKVAVVSSNERVSWGRGSIRRYELRALPADPPYSSTLAPSIREIIRAEPRLKTLVLAPRPPHDFGIAFYIEHGRITGVAGVPPPWGG